MTSMLKRRVSGSRKASEMNDEGFHEGGRLVTYEWMAKMEFSSIAEANAAIRAGKIKGPLIRGYTTIPPRWSGNILE